MKQSYWFGIIMLIFLLLIVIYNQYTSTQQQKQIDLYQVRNQFELMTSDGRSRLEKISGIKTMSSVSSSLSTMYDNIYHIGDDVDLGIILNNPLFVPILSSQYKEYISYYDTGYDQLDSLMNDVQEFVYNYDVDSIVYDKNSEYSVCLTGAFGYQQANASGSVRGPFVIDACVPVIFDQDKLSINQEKFQQLVQKQESQ